MTRVTALLEDDQHKWLSMQKDLTGAGFSAIIRNLIKEKQICIKSTQLPK